MVFREDPRPGSGSLSTGAASPPKRRYRPAESTRAWAVAADLEARTRKLEEFTAGQKVRVAVAACIASAVVSGEVGLILHFGKR